MSFDLTKEDLDGIPDKVLIQLGRATINEVLGGKESKRLFPEYRQCKAFVYVKSENNHRQCQMNAKSGDRCGMHKPKSNNDLAT